MEFIKKCLNLLLLTIILGSCKIDNAKNARRNADQIIEDISNGTAIKDFPQSHFPVGEGAKILFALKETCDFKNRNGTFINDYRKKDLNKNTDEISFIYEYYLKCDSIRLIFTYNVIDSFELTGFRLESIEDDNAMITEPSRRLWK